MSVQISSLASGFLASSGGAVNPIYASPTGLTTIIKSIRLMNNDATPQTVNLYMNRSPDNTNRYITPKNLTIPAGGLVIDDQEITMSSGDKINYDTTAAR